MARSDRAYETVARIWCFGWPVRKTMRFALVSSTWYQLSPFKEATLTECSELCKFIQERTANEVLSERRELKVIEMEEDRKLAYIQLLSCGVEIEDEK